MRPFTIRGASVCYQIDLPRNHSTDASLPEVIEPIHAQQFLKISRTHAYDLFKSKQFHVAKVGRLYKATKEVFVEWLEGKKSVPIGQQEKAPEQLMPDSCNACPLYSLLEKGITLTLKIEARK